MPLDLQLLGGPRDDNALFVRVRTGQAVYRLLFDCGEGCAREVPGADVREMDHLLFSHLHLDHVAGFDSFFRVNAARPWPVTVWGPPQTARLIHHRLQGVMWNLHARSPGRWDVWDIEERELRGQRFLLREAFGEAHDLGAKMHSGVILDADAFTVEATLLDHRTPSAAYIVREKPRLNVDAARLHALNLPPGPWLSDLKEGRVGELEVGGQVFDFSALRRDLLTETPGESAAYLTDFLLDGTAMAKLIPLLRGVGTLFCESQYRASDAHLAAENHHLTGVQAAELARGAEVGRLILFHVSERYRPPELLELLAEAQGIFPNTSFPEHWEL